MSYAGKGAIPLRVCCCLLVVTALSTTCSVALAFPYGDVDQDGDVDGDDLGLLRANFGAVGVPQPLGDSTLDGDVDGDDLVLTQAGFVINGRFPIPPLAGVEVAYTFTDADLDEVFDVFVEVLGESDGLATYSVALDGLDGSPIDASQIDWEENVLGNMTPDLEPVGIAADRLLESAIGTNGFAAANSQFLRPNPIFGIGRTPLLVEGAPGSADVDLDAPALLGRLSVPGANGLTDSELLALFSPNATVHDSTVDPLVRLPESVSASIVRGIVPEPTAVTLLLATFAAIRFLRDTRS